MTYSRAALLVGVVGWVPLSFGEVQDLRGAEPAAGIATGAADTVEASTPTLESLASKGRFDQVLEALRSNPELPENAAAGSLIADLQRYQANSAERQAERRAAYDKALVTVREKFAADDLEAALIAAIEAHSLAADPAVVLADPIVVDLVARTAAAAKAAEGNEDWVEAGVLYGRLNLLFENTAQYRADVKRINTHLRVLALYTPRAFRKLQAARAERVGQDIDINAVAADDEPWQTRLNNVDVQMLRESIKTAAEQHIDHGGYAVLMAGSLDPLLTLLATPAVAQTFPSLGDAGAVEEFRAELLNLKAEFENPERQLTQFRAMSRIDQVLAANARTVKLPESVIAYEMAEGAMATLDDFSSMYWPEDVAYLARSTQGEFTGIGVQITRRINDERDNNTAPVENEIEPLAGGNITVISPIVGSPAMEAGIKAGDVILTVDGKDASNWSLTRAVREITGPRGTVVKLGIQRPGSDSKDLIHFDVTRDTIAIESVKGWVHDQDGDWNYWLDKDAGVGYIRLTQFIPQSVDSIDAALAELNADGKLNSLILDLRHNPGGLLTSAIQLVNRFLDEGPILYTVDGDRNVKSAWTARRRGTYPDLNLVILINQGSASASEIVSGALQDRGRAFIVGDRSFGKGSVQDVYWFPSPRDPAFGLKVTTQYYQLPGGRIIHRTPESTTWGIEPDLVVPVTNQVVAWNLELRQEIDVLRDKDIKTMEAPLTKPWVKLVGREPVDPDADNAKETVVLPVPTPQDLLKLGLDPQLEAALLLCKTKQIAGDVTIAAKP